jgi:hypothetical protein
MAGLSRAPKRNCSLYKLLAGVKDGNHFGRPLFLTFQEPFCIKQHSFGQPPAVFGRETYMEERKE